MTNDLNEYFEFVFPQKELSAWDRLMLLSLYVSNQFRCDEQVTVTLGRVATLAGASETKCDSCAGFGQELCPVAQMCA